MLEALFEDAHLNVRAHSPFLTLVQVWGPRYSDRKHATSAVFGLTCLPGTCSRAARVSSCSARVVHFLMMTAPRRTPSPIPYPSYATMILSYFVWPMLYYHKVICFRDPSPPKSQTRLSWNGRRYCHTTITQETAVLPAKISRKLNRAGERNIRYLLYTRHIIRTALYSVIYYPNYLYNNKLHIHHIGSRSLITISFTTLGSNAGRYIFRSKGYFRSIGERSIWPASLGAAQSLPLRMSWHVNIPGICTQWELCRGGLMPAADSAYGRISRDIKSRPGKRQ